MNSIRNRVYAGEIAGLITIATDHPQSPSSSALL